MNELQWKAIYSNDRAYDGEFYYALATTRIVCNPSCTSRTPNPKNVTIFKNFKSALDNGYRPCNRCKPDLLEWEGYKEELVERVKLYIEENYEKNITLSSLSSTLKKNPQYIQRVFKLLMGVTPLNYMHTVRITRAKEMLQNNMCSITNIALEVGYNSSAHFSSKFRFYENITPKEFRSSKETEI